jgi:hypothetical protein
MTAWTHARINAASNALWSKVHYTLAGSPIPPPTQSPAPARTEDIAPLPQLHTGPGWWMNIWKDKL